MSRPPDPAWEQRRMEEAVASLATCRKTLETLSRGAVEADAADLRAYAMAMETMAAHCQRRAAHWEQEEQEG